MQISEFVTFAVQGEKLTAYDIAQVRGHTECMDILRQHGGKSSVDCTDSNESHEERAGEAAAREAEYWVSDELELQQHAAQLVTMSINNAIELQQRLDSDDDDRRPATNVRINYHLVVSVYS